MSALTTTRDLFFAHSDLSAESAERIVADALHGADDGELFLEHSLSESLSFDDGRLKHASSDISSGFGLRAVSGELSAYAHAAEISESALKRAAATVSAVTRGANGTLELSPSGSNTRLYSPDNPIDGVDFATKIKLLTDIDAYLRAADPRVIQASISLAANWQAVRILRPDGKHLADIRPMVRLNISVLMHENGRTESGSAGGGGRHEYGRTIAPENWQHFADMALAQAKTNLTAIPAPAGEMVVVLGSGWPGVLLHEAVGHGLEGDFNRKGSSAFAGKMGQRVAARGVTVVDDGTLPDRRGSLSIDDEGTATGRTVLIEDGILTGYMQDRMNARLMGTRSTGNGRRQSFAHAPMPRMTNTFMLGGSHDPAEIIASVKKGIYATQFGGGQVDITSGKYVFSATEAFLIENGKITAPIKGATLIGDGPSDLNRVSMIGNDMALDNGVGTCGKAGQGVPVGIGQPTIRLDGLTVGGTNV